MLRVAARCAVMSREVLINSGVSELLSVRVQIKALIAANSKAIGKISNADMDYYRRKAVRNELISTSPGLGGTEHRLLVRLSSAPPRTV